MRERERERGERQTERDRQTDRLNHAYPSTQGLVVEVDEVIQDHVGGREDRLAEGLGHPKVFQSDQTNQFLKTKVNFLIKVKLDQGSHKTKQLKNCSKH